MQRKLLGLLFSAAAYGFYKYSRMTPEEKQDIKKRGSDFLKSLVGVRNNTVENKMPVVSAENNY